MKSYDQALNEIYQKAQQRADQRKKRNKIVLAILPVFCIVALTLAVIFLATPPATSDPGSDPVAPPSDSLQNEDPEDEPNVKDEDNGNTDVTPDQNEDGTEGKQDDPPVIKYVTNSNGSFIYIDYGTLDADDKRQETLYFVSANKIPFVLGYGAKSSRETLEELEGERDFSFGDKVIRLQYQYSYRIEDGSSGLVARYINTDYYRDGSGQSYQVSSYTGEIFDRYYNVNEGVPRGTLSVDGALEAAVAFLSAQLDGFDLSQYRIYGPNLNYANDGGGYYKLQLTRQLHGFDTNEKIIMSIAGTGEVMTYIHKLPHLYDGVEDTLSEEDIENAVWDLRSTLHSVRAGGIDMNTITILTDDEGKLYVRAVGRNGYLYYNEIVLKN